MTLPERVAIEPAIMNGKPCIRGTRIPVYILLQKLAAGETEAEIFGVYPQLTAADLRAALEYAARAAAEEIVLSEP